MKPSKTAKHSNTPDKPQRWFSPLCNFWSKNIWNKIFVFLLAALFLCTGTMYGIAQWYIRDNASEPLKLGASFIPAYAESLGLDAKHTMDAMINDLGVRHFRLVSYWDQLEPTPGHYNFDLLDWQFKKAEDAGAKVSLSLGLRQPRWPECHPPSWATNESDAIWQKQLNDFIAATVNHYKHSKALDSYQLENEYFLRGFGLCTNFDRQRLIDEFNLVKSLDPYHKVILSRSNNTPTMPLGQPTPDEFGLSIYRRVWDSSLTHRYFQYPMPAWYYGFLAGSQKILTGKNSMIHELQAEAWPPNGKGIQEISLSEQNKSIDSQRLEGVFQFGQDTGMREMYLWGAEYWYYRLVKLDDPSLWNVAKENYAPLSEAHN